MRVVLIQGAMDIEVQYMISLLKEKQITKIAGYEFYEGIIHNTKVVISKTLIGTINATMATSIGIMKFNPDIVINQGIAGAHSENIHIGDIVIGEACSNINSYDMSAKKKGEGSNPFEWELNKRAKDIKYADLQLVDIAEKSLLSKTKNRVFRGMLGSGDAFNREYDRISWLNRTFHSLCEDMESISVYSVCKQFEVPCIGIRIISNNELLLEKLNEEKAIELQAMLISILDNLVEIEKRI